VQKDKLLRELNQIRRRGYSVNRGEHLIGRAAIGAPIWGRAGSPIASMSVSGLTEVIDGRTEKLASELMKTTSTISELMGFSTFVAFPLDR
jgi:IclR family acetate operon transcriptional repressor